MTEIRDVNTTTSHEEKVNKDCESATKAMLSHEVRVPNYQVMESLNSLQLDGQEKSCVTSRKSDICRWKRYD